MFVDNIKVFIL